MGVPKFFRYISERYPCLSEFVKEYQIPEFDNLYLDMNGIIHMCSHPDDGVHFRISEEKIFTDIFHYIEVLFRMIKPQRLFFMAIDGVAPRAKMNQQRSRRFRSAKDAEKMEIRAKQQGEDLPDEARFDSNCITPGTVFMARLQEQLKYFIVNKITNDKLWRNCKIILSGHETPGEGEHKIMDYIRYMRAQPGYDPNTRHCLYGLDADLIMLGLCTHEPHFSLLREEVLFGKKSTKRKSIPEQISFYLLHLSLMREYLEQEFIELKTVLPFEYDMEKIIDDWVLMGFLVGNDFIPHLPNLHIANGALPVLYKAYIKVLPTLGGYINEGGHLHLDRFEKFMDALCEVDMEHFSENYADLQYFESKTGRRPNDKERTSYKPRTFVPFEMDECAFALGALEEQYDIPKNSELQKLIQATDDLFLAPSQSNISNIPVMNDDELDDDVQSDSGSDSDEDKLLKAEFKLHKRDYYMNKLDYEKVTPEVLRSQAEGYVRAIQWNLNYYYNGVCSWGWYYPHHYAPFISDIKNFKDLKIDFELGTPFHPYEQLLAVLPTASKSFLPECYHGLMTDITSPIKDYYPEDFLTDLNGKKQDWEAVVLLPFINEERLLEAMAPCNLLLTDEEIKRNTHGPMLEYEYVDENRGDYEAPEYFPDVKNHCSKWTAITIESIRVPRENLVKGAYPGAIMDVYYPGFPTMKHLKYKSRLEKAKVKVFDQPSRGENLILLIINEQNRVAEEVATEMLGKVVLVGWPHLVEALVTSVSTTNFRYHQSSTGEKYHVEENTGNLEDNWRADKRLITDYYMNRLGVDVGTTKILLHVKIMTGRKYIFTPNGTVKLEKQWASQTSAYPFQTVVQDVEVHSKAYRTYSEVQEVFPVDSSCFMLGQPHYGWMGTVMDSTDSLIKGRLKIAFEIGEEPDLYPAMEMENKLQVTYMVGYQAAKSIGISAHLLSRLTGNIFIIMGGPRPVVDENANKINIGLNMKYTKKNEEIPGYTKREKYWTYSPKATKIITDYLDKFPKVMDYLVKHLESDNFYEYEIFPEDKGSGKSVKEVAEWIKTLPYTSVEKQSCGSLILEPDVVTEVERLVDEHNKVHKLKPLVMQVKPHLLYKPDLQIGNIAPDPTTKYTLFDRVVNVRDSYTVPLGYTGTVIAVHSGTATVPEDIMYDVLFDQSFAGGLSLNCSVNRGYRMSSISLINKSHGMRQYEEATGKKGELLQRLSQTSNTNQSRNSFQKQNHFSNFSQRQNSAFVTWSNFNQPMQSQPSQSSHNPTPNVTVSNNNTAKTTGDTNPNYQAKNKGPKQPQILKRSDFMPGFAVPKIETKVNTDVLKKMLKIDENQSQESTSVPPSPSTAGTGQPISVQDIFAHASAQLQTAQPTNTPNFCLQLLSYFQMHGLGCPHYVYMNTPDGQWQAHLDLPFANMKKVVGLVAPTKEEASENVAQSVLERLNVNKTPPLDNLPVKFPVPPKQWCEPGQKRHNNKNSSPQKYKNSADAKNMHSNKKTNNSYKQSAVSFVPLQAVRQQRLSKSESLNDNIENKIATKPENKNEVKKESPLKADNKQGASPKNHSKPRRERKMRIAANFSVGPN